MKPIRAQLRRKRAAGAVVAALVVLAGLTGTAAGQAQRSVHLLEQARGLFNSSTKEYALCSALLCEFREHPDLKTAAHAYERAGHNREARITRRRNAAYSSFSTTGRSRFDVKEALTAEGA